MGKTIADLVNILGVALVLGLLLRYGAESKTLIETTGQQLTSIYDTISLQTVAK